MISNHLLSRGVRLALALSVATGFAPAAFAQNAPAATGQETLQEVVVTGSSIKGLDVETALPVTVLSSLQIEQSGVTDIEQLIAKVSSTSSVGATRTSDTAGLATYGLATASMRGLGGNRTLVLLNGKRLSSFAGAGSGAVDINSIPLAAIERVEVLRDGASSVYGSDAVAGVMNFILKSNFNGAQVGVDLGKPMQHGGGSVNRFDAMFGFGEPGKDKYNVMVGASVERGSALFAKDRAYASTGNNLPFYQSGATPSGRIEGIWIPGQSRGANGALLGGYSSSGYGNPAAYAAELAAANPDSTFAFPSCGDINMFQVSGLGGKDGHSANCNFDSAPFVGLFPKSEHVSGYASGKYEISDTLRLHAEFNYSKNKLTEAYQPSPERAAFLATDNAFGPTTTDPALLVFPTNPIYNSLVVPYLNLRAATDTTGAYAAMIGQPIAVSLRTFLTGPRTEEDTATQTRFVFGLDGSAMNWDYDASVLYSDSKTDGKVIDGYFSQIALATILNDPASNWNPWAPAGVQSADLTSKLQAAKYVGPTIGAKTSLASLDASASRTITTLSGGPLKVAVGLNVRQEKYTITVPDILGSGDIAGLGGATLPIDEKRNASALFAEFNAPVLEQLEFNLSGRFDHYGDVGNTTNGKISTRWQPIKQIVVRAAAGTGFRAPSLTELHNPQTLGSSEQFIDPAFPNNGPQQPNSVIGGNPNLKPEKSKQATFGIAVSPIPTVTLSVDYFHIQIDDYITAPAALGLVIAARAGHPLYGPDDVIFAGDGTVDTVNQVLRNSASALVTGLDIGLNWTDNFSYGKVSFNLNGTYMDKFDLTTLIGTQHSVGTIVQPDGTPLDVAGLGVIPRYRHTSDLSVASGHWTTAATWDFYSGYRDANDLNGNNHYVPQQSIFGLNVSYTGLIKGLNLSVGAKNIFNTQPPVFIGNGSSFQFGYDPTMYDPRGRFAYVRASYKFL